MIWDKDVSFEGYDKKKAEWFDDPEHFLGDPPISAQYALDLIFKTLADDKESYRYLTAMPQTEEQTNSIMLEVILRKYSRKYRKYLKNLKKEKKMKVSDIRKIINDCDRLRNILLQDKHKLVGSEIQEIRDLLWAYKIELLNKEVK